MTSSICQRELQCAYIYLKSPDWSLNSSVVILQCTKRTRWHLFCAVQNILLPTWIVSVPLTRSCNTPPPRVQFFFLPLFIFVGETDTCKWMGGKDSLKDGKCETHNKNALQDM